MTAIGFMGTVKAQLHYLQRRIKSKAEKMNPVSNIVK